MGKTRREAEERAKAMYAEELEDEEDLRVSGERMTGEFVDWQDVRHKYAK